MKTLGELMAEGGELLSTRPAVAMNLLAQGRIGRPDVPDTYNIMLCRAALESDQPDVALSLLEQEINEGAPSTALRRAYSEVLVSAGKMSEAGAQLNVAVQAGMPAQTLPIQMKLVLQEHLRRHHPDAQGSGTLDELPVLEFAVVDERSKVTLIYCPKVACTVLKATIVMNSPLRDEYLASRITVHEFVGRNQSEGRLLSAIKAPNAFCFTVLRDPATRILSAYLNKFVPAPPREPLGLLLNKRYAIRVGQRLASVEPDISRGITFEEFVHFLAQASDLELDVHWMPQSRIIGTDLRKYSHVGRFETLSDTFALLARRFGYAIESDSSVHLDGQKDHATKFSPSRTMKRPYQALPADLRRLGSIYPIADAFLTPELRAILVRRFAIDADLHTAI